MSDTMSRTLTLKGRLRVVERFTDDPNPWTEAVMQRNLAEGQARIAFQGDNLITDIGLATLTALFAGGYGNPTVGSTHYDKDTVHPAVPTTGAFMSSMMLTARAFGTLTPPAIGDTALQGTVIFSRTTFGTPPLAIVTYPSAGSVRLSANVPQPDFDGTTFTEEGVFSADGQLLARVIFQEVKTLAYALQFDHDFEIARV